MTNNSSQRLGLLFLALVLIELFFLSSFGSLDAACANWIEAHRSCLLDSYNMLLSNWPIVALVSLSVFALGWLCMRRQWAEARHGALTVVIGMFLSELLKTGFERARPSVLPPLIVGNSFPSGHVASALLLAGTLSFLLARQRWAVWVKLSEIGLLAGLVGLITWQRLYLAHHWLSDVLGSFLLAGAWLCFTLPRPACMRISRRFVFACAILLGCYQVFYFFPRMRFALPSVTAATREPVFALSFGELGNQNVLEGAWGDRGLEPVGPVTWMEHGEASVAALLPEHQAYLMKLAVRPLVQSKAFACFPLEVRINQRQAGRILLYRGWREYALRLDPRWLAPGTNAITFQAGAAFPDSTPDLRTVAFRHLYLFAESQ
ncbi:MAG TPA: phosphatase PAP2 family protein [Candidatus Binatia bacterium]|nr:phosphatase PAP2 family protein [Candidatus Binatia bacterium]